MATTVSIIIPNRNGESTIGRCLEATFASTYKNYEVIVVDDFSDDHSLELIRQFPCKLIPLKSHCGASKTRNIGAEHSSGDILFFTDADCLLNKDTLAIAVNTLLSSGQKVVVGGTYTLRAADDNFFSHFQSAFIHYFESKNALNPDYVATHAMAINASDFKKSDGFAEGFLPILEDVEYSHRMQRNDYTLQLDPSIQVKHIFGYTLLKSLANAFRKSMYWTAYSVDRQDLLKDSGTASFGLKLNTFIWFINALMLILFSWTDEKLFLLAIFPLFFINLVANRGLLNVFYKAGGTVFFCAAIFYYFLVYPIAVAAGSFTGMLRYLWLKKTIGYSH